MYIICSFSLSHGVPLLFVEKWKKNETRILHIRYTNTSMTNNEKRMISICCTCGYEHIWFVCMRVFRRFTFFVFLWLFRCVLLCFQFFAEYSLGQIGNFSNVKLGAFNAHLTLNVSWTLVVVYYHLRLSLIISV